MKLLECYISFDKFDLSSKLIFEIFESFPKDYNLFKRFERILIQIFLFKYGN